MVVVAMWHVRSLSTRLGGTCSICIISFAHVPRTCFFAGHHTYLGFRHAHVGISELVLAVVDFAVLHGQQFYQVRFFFLFVRIIAVENFLWRINTHKGKRAHKPNGKEIERESSRITNTRNKSGRIHLKALSRPNSHSMKHVEGEQYKKNGQMKKRGEIIFFRIENKMSKKKKISTKQNACMRNEKIRT